MAPLCYKVTALIDGCGQLQRPNFPSKLGHIPSGSLWKQQRPTGRQQSAVPTSQGLRPAAFILFSVFEASGKRFCIGASRRPATFRERGRQPIINQDTQDWPAAFMPVERVGEELGPLERTADVCVAAR